MENDNEIINFSRGKLVHGECINEMKKMKNQSINMIFADPPYFLSNGGISVRSGKKVSVDKGEWDKKESHEKIIDFTKSWVGECKRILEPNGTIWITGTFHNIFEIGGMLKKFNFKILNIVTWVKEDPPPNLSGRMFTHSSEFIIWAKQNPKSRQFYNLSLMTKMNNDRPMTDVWVLPHVSTYEKAFGYHPTQKPLKLMERVILSSTRENDLILDPFSGSGTTAVAAIKANRRFIGIENNDRYFQTSNRRVSFFINQFK